MMYNGRAREFEERRGQQHQTTPDSPSDVDGRIHTIRRTANPILTDTLCMSMLVLPCVTWLATSYLIFACHLAPPRSQRISSGNLNDDAADDSMQQFSRFLMPVFLGLVISVVMMAVLLILLRLIPTIMVWIIIGGLHGLLVAAAIIGFVEYGKPAGNTADKGVAGLIIAILMVILLTISAAVLLVTRRRISLAIALIKESNRMVASMWSTTFFPIIPAFLSILVIQIAFISTVGLYSLKSSKHPGDLSDATIYFLHTFNIIGSAWTVLYISAARTLTLANAFGACYWTRYTSHLPCCVACESATLMLRYNGGTAAFGAVMIDVLRPMLLVLSTCAGKTSATLATNARHTRSWLKQTLKLYNRNALIMCALSGDGLRDSALKAYELVRRNRLGCVQSSRTTDIVFGFGKMLSVIVMVISGGAYFRSNFGEIPATPMVALAIGAYFVANGFFSVYVVAVDTLVLCALEDAELNDGSIERPHLMSAQLKNILVNTDESHVYRPTELESAQTGADGLSTDVDI